MGGFNIVEINNSANKGYILTSIPLKIFHFYYEFISVSVQICLQVDIGFIPLN